MAKRPSPSRDLDSCNLFVKYLPAHLTDEELHSLFKDFGEIVSSKIMIDQTTGKSLGYGFVRYRTADQANVAIEKMNGVKVSTKRLLCKLANHSSTTTPNQSSPPSQHAQASSTTSRSGSRNQTPSNNLYIRPLTPETTEEQLRDLFGRYGTVVDAKVMIDRNTGQSRLIGFVRFETEANATLAMRELQGHMLAEDATPLQIKYADSERQKEQRRARNQQLHQGGMISHYPQAGPIGIPYWPVPVGAPPMPWQWVGQPGTSPPGMPPYPGMPPGWHVPYGMPIPGFASPPLSSSADGVGGEAVPPNFSPELSHATSTGDVGAPHFSPHLLPPHVLGSPPMLPYDPLMMHMSNLTLGGSPAGYQSNQANGDVDGGDAKNRNSSAQSGAGGETVDSN